MKDIILKIKNRRKHIALVSFMVILFIIFSLLRFKSFLANFPILILTFLFSGIGLAKFLKRTLSYKNTVTYLTYSLILGSLTTILVLLFLGMCGVEYTDQFLLIFFICFSVLNVTYFLIPKKDSEDLEIFKFPHLRIIDVVWLLLISLMFFFLFSLSVERYFPNWDSFTFWAVDAKYIYQNRILRDSNFDVINDFSYSSFYPLNIFLSYVFFGGIYEQFSSLITLYYAFLSFLLLSTKILVIKSNIVKSLSFLSVIVVLHAFLSVQNIIVSQYADVFSAFVVLFYSIVLTSPTSEKYYYQRFLLLFFSSLILYLTKSPYKILTILLLFIWLIYDLRFLRSKFLKLVTNWRFLVSLCFVGIFCGSLYLYQIQFRLPSILNSLSAMSKELILADSIKYSFHVIKFLSGNLPFIFLISGILPFLFLERSFKDKRFIFIGIIFLALISINIFRYILLLLDLGSMSLLRYVSISFFLIPLLITKAKLVKMNTLFKDIVITLILLIMGVYVLLLVFFFNNLDFKLDAHSGRYQDFQFQESSYKIAERVLLTVEREDKVLITDKVNSGVGNMAIPGIYIRYYLFDNSIGGQYSSSIENFPNFVNKTDPDYLLIVGYDDYWKDCNNFLETDKTYLIPIDKFIYDNESCPIEEGSYELNP